MLAVYHPTMVAADTADDKLDAVIGIELRLRVPFWLIKRSSFTGIGESCKEASVLA
jgi:hypothetical protein